jgi:anti-anti-sigma factor
MAGSDAAPVAFSGEIDRDRADEIRSLIMSVPSMIVEVDTSEVTFIDSAGLAILVGIRATLDAEGRRLVLINRSANLDRLLEITDLADMFS